MLDATNAVVNPRPEYFVHDGMVDECDAVLQQDTCNDASSEWLEPKRLSQRLHGLKRPVRQHCCCLDR